jgi:hypothetical protein
VKVSCEHYDRSEDVEDDDYIVPGSEYALECNRMDAAQVG